MEYEQLFPPNTPATNSWYERRKAQQEAVREQYLETVPPRTTRLDVNTGLIITVLGLIYVATSSLKNCDQNQSLYKAICPLLIFVGILLYLIVRYLNICKRVESFKIQATSTVKVVNIEARKADVNQRQSKLARTMKGYYVAGFIILLLVLLPIAQCAHAAWRVPCPAPSTPSSPDSSPASSPDSSPASSPDSSPASSPNSSRDSSPAPRRLRLQIFLGRSRARPFCLKALESFTKDVGPETIDVAGLRRDLGIIFTDSGCWTVEVAGPISRNVLARVSKNLEVIYGELGEHENTLEIYKNRVGDNLAELALARKNVEVELGEDEKAEAIYGGARGCSSTTECASEMMQAATNLLALGLNEESIGMFTDVRAVLFVFIARGLWDQGKFAEAKRSMKLAQIIFEKKEINHLIRATAFVDMLKVYKKMKEYENTISYAKRALAIPELPEDRLINSSTRLFSLISESGKHKREISYLKELVLRLKEKLGPEHVQVGFGYINLGLGYMLSGKPDAAAEVFVLAKDAFDVSLGPHKLDSPRTSQTIYVTYPRLGRYEAATLVQETVVKSLRGLHGPREQEFLNMAVKLLEDMKEKVAGPVSWEVLYEDGRGHSSTM